METKPDFNRLRTALLGGKPDRVPLGDWLVDQDVKDAFMGKPVADLKAEVEFWSAAGFDHIPLAAGILNPLAQDKIAGGTGRKGCGNYSIYQVESQEKTWAEEEKGVITTLEGFENYQWPGVDDFSYSVFEKVKEYLPEGMKVTFVLGKIYTPVWMLMGAETFFFSLIENEPLIERMFYQVGKIQFEVFEKAVEFDTVGAVLMPDDIAHNLGLFISPKYLRKYLFPWYKRIGDVCKERGLPYIYHSDGNLWEVMEDIIDAGYNALHPIQPSCMDIKEVKERYGDRLCLIGNINLDYTLTRGAPEEVVAEVRQRIRDIAPGGGYCVASSNSVTNYVPLENFKAMIEAVMEFGRYPISY